MSTRANMVSTTPISLVTPQTIVKATGRGEKLSAAGSPPSRFGWFR